MQYGMESLGRSKTEMNSSLTKQGLRTSGVRLQYGQHAAGMPAGTGAVPACVQRQYELDE